MATNDIGRVTPIWRGFYSAATTYELNDIVIDTAGSVWWHKSEEITTGVAPGSGEIWDAVIDMSIFSGLIQAAITTAQTALAAAQAALADVAADMERAETAADNAENSAAAASESAAGVGAFAQAAAASAEAAAGSATGAAGSAQAAAGSKSDAEAYAVGTRGGEDVESTDPTYHNNAKYYAEQAGSSAEAAAQSAEDAQDVLDSIPEDYSQLSADVGDLKTQLALDESVIFSETTIPTAEWSSGLWNGTTGADNGNPERIKTNNYIGKNIVKIYCSDTYRFGVAAWDSNDVFVGSYNNGGFSKASYTWIKEFDCTQYPDYKFKVTLRYATGTADMPTSESENCKFLQSNIRTDTTLTEHDIAADAYTVGAKLFDAENIKYGAILPTSTQYALEFDTTNHTVKINSGYLATIKNSRISISGTTIDYRPTTPLATQTIAIVYDEENSVIKPVYAIYTAPFKKFILLAYFNANEIDDGIISTISSYLIDSKYYGNISEELSNQVKGTQNIKLRVGSYNVGEYTMGVMATPVTEAMQSEITENMRAFLAEQNLDIIGLQENRTDLYDKTSQESFFDYLYTDSISTTNWTAIETRRTLKNNGSGHLTAGNRGYVYGTIEIEGKEIFLMSVHLALDYSDRQSNYSELFTILDSHEYFILFGDFNAGNGGGGAATEFGALVSHGYHVSNGGYLGLFQTMGAIQQYFDNIVTSNNIIITNTYVPDIYSDMNSDHIPIISELEIVVE